MSKRTDTESRLIRAPAATIYRSFETADAMKAWLPPQGMTATVLAFAFQEGGGYRLRLTYNEPHHTPGKTSAQSDEVDVRFIKLVPNERIEQVVTFVSDDPAYAGEMHMQWRLEPDANGTVVTICCEDVPTGIRAEDHSAGLKSSLSNLAVYAEAGA